mgnify:CR=1 FL=1
MATIKVTQTKSSIGRLPKHKACLKGLGLRRINHTVELEDLYVIKLTHPWWSSEHWSDVPLVKQGFRFTSDANENWLSAEELKSLLP